MDITTFLMLLFSFSIITSLVMEVVKKIIGDKQNFSYNIATLCIAIVIGCVGMIVYYVLAGIPYTTKCILYVPLMGFASGLCAMLGYDKVKQAILQITDKNTK